jgi:hypothetical protein
MGYAEDTEYAAKNLINLAMHEENDLSRLRQELAQEMGKYAANRWDFETSDLNDDFTDAHVMAAFHRMAKAKIQADQIALMKSSLEASVGARQFAVQALWGALLQIAKQGISIVHGGLKNAPDGRLLLGTPLKEIIWQGRNQAIHFEEGNFTNHVKNTFASLEVSFGAEFSLSNHFGQSRSKQIALLLGWNDYQNFKNDMKSLGL